MRILTRLTLLVSLLALASATAFASPINWFGETVADPSAYDLTVVHTGTATYDWTVHFNGTTLVGHPQKMMAFVVFDPNATLTDGAWAYLTKADTTVVDWLVKTRTGAGDMVVEWNSPTSGPGDTAVICETLVAHATFDQPLADPYFWTAIHIGGEPDSIWSNKTPELPPSALLSLSMLPLGIAYLRGRRRKED